MLDEKIAHIVITIFAVYGSIFLMLMPLAERLKEVRQKEEEYKAQLKRLQTLSWFN